VAGIVRVPSVMEVSPSVPLTTVAELITYAKANPGQLAMASAGNGSSSHVAGELFKMMADVDLLHVPYRGAAPALTDLIAGRVQVYFDLMPNSIEQIRAGKVRPLAVTGATRSPAMPAMPTVGEFVPGYEVAAWFGVGAPKGTPAEIVDRLNHEINAGLAAAKMKARLTDLGGTVLTGTPVDFRQAHCRRNREVGQGDQVRRHQGELMRRSRQYSATRYEQGGHNWLTYGPACLLFSQPGIRSCYCNAS
jgi:tripartite-type tricarboxylate transporter receptor subunit TctC